jgi:hypothetical protein
MKSTILTALILALPCVFACKEDPITTLDRTTDCAKICNKYKECLNNDYDTSKCEDSCTDMIDDQKTKRIDDCESCVDDRSCANSTFACASQCVGIVP